MPAYNFLVPPPAIETNESYLVWNADTPASGTLSQQVALARSRGGYPPAASVEVIFSASPGAFEIDVQEADTDLASNYVGALGGALTTATLGANGTYVVRIDLNPVTARFLSLLMKTAPTWTSLTVTARIVRQ